MYSTNPTLATEMDRVLMGDPRFFRFRIGRVEKIGEHAYNDVYDPSLTEGVYNKAFYKKNNFNWWISDSLSSDYTYDDLFKMGNYHMTYDFGYIFGKATAGIPVSDSTKHYLLHDYFCATYMLINSPLDWDPGFDTYVNPATFDVDFSKDTILVLYLRPFTFQLPQSAFFFFQSVGAYKDSNGVLHIVFTSNGENYWRSGYVEVPDGMGIIGFEYEFPTYIIEGIVLPKSVVESIDPYNIVFEWDLFAGDGDGIIKIK